MTDDTKAAAIKVIITHMNALPHSLARMFGESATTYFDGHLCLAEVIRKATELIERLRTARDEIREFEKPAANIEASTDDSGARPPVKPHADGSATPTAHANDPGKTHPKRQGKQTGLSVV
ncbi:hypothetical protein J8273_0538 [Carpediemonas membranifera]|uniref:Uncharacterized protein n=1 Tax=Carpediemonas membranifera TaxID=201153 RepID=A0A8J6AVL4_9EUKA|nr:hypothetical protein J8273_0538 [Carpediemonas membranifera]|eukprot:KAG9395308.1 hypothetical protein J8273_0538 [Carpediemonas membranifera]